MYNLLGIKSMGLVRIWHTVGQMNLI